MNTVVHCFFMSLCHLLSSKRDIRFDEGNTLNATILSMAAHSPTKSMHYDQYFVE